VVGHHSLYGTGWWAPTYHDTATPQYTRSAAGRKRDISGAMYRTTCDIALARRTTNSDRHQVTIHLAALLYFYLRALQDINSDIGRWRRGSAWAFISLPTYVAYTTFTVLLTSLRLSLFLL